MKARNSLRRKLPAAAFFVTVLCASIAACAEPPRVIITSAAGTTVARVNVEVASTPAERELGLMYRQHLDENAGMIFVFPGPDQLSFWMKNTEIPLDMIFAESGGKIIGVVENAEPFTETARGVQGDSLYVLEVNGGFAKRHHVGAGDRLKFVGFVARTSQ
jgi:uncharacterized membrane protein (UPF0127 family)